MISIYLYALLNFLHPFFVSVTEVKHNDKTKNLEISCKVFFDDFEAALEKKYQTKLNILKPTENTQINPIIQDYLQKHLQIKINGKPVNAKYLGFEIEEDAAWCYLEIPKVNQLKRLEIRNDILFVTVLCSSYTLLHWQRILWEVTAFTIGHSLTLALSVLNIVRLPTSLIEFLIPVTIMITALFNIRYKNANATSTRISYWLTLFFGLIHGMGFSNYLKSLLGKSTNIILELFSFNLGLEFGQLIIVLVVLVLGYLAVNWFRVIPREWNLFVSAAIFGIAATMALERFFVLI